MLVLLFTAMQCMGPYNLYKHCFIRMLLVYSTMPISKLISNPLDSDTANIYNLSVVCLTTELVNLMAIEIGIGFV